MGEPAQEGGKQEEDSGQQPPPWRPPPVPCLLRDAVAHCHAPGEGRWPPDVPFASAVDPDVQAGAMLARAVYKPPVEMMREIKQFDRSILKIDEPELDRAGESQFAFFCRMKGPSPVTWTVARGTSTSTWDDLWIDLFYLMLGRPWANPDFKKLLVFHDTCCENTESMCSIHNFRRIAVGHSKAGAEVAELALARSGVEVHAFNDGGALNLNVLDVSPLPRQVASSPSVMCHRIRGDLVCALRLPVGTTRYYAKDPWQPNPHSMGNFVASAGPPPKPLTEGLAGWRRWCGMGVFFARTRDLQDESVSILHPTQHAILALGTWLASAGIDGPVRASWLSSWALLRSLCAEGPPWWQGLEIGALSLAESYLEELGWAERAAICATEAFAAGCFAAGHWRAGLFLQMLRAQLLRCRCSGDASWRCLEPSRLAAPHVGQRLGAAIWSQVAALCPPLPLCSGSSPCAMLLRGWASRELAVVVGGQWGARATALWPELFMALYCLPTGVATFALLLRRFDGQAAPRQ